MKSQTTILGNEHNTRDVARWSERIARVENGNISYGHSMSNKDSNRNLDIFKFTGTSPAANIDFTLNHSLGRVPITIVGQDTTNGGLIYRSPTIPWTKTTVSFRCTTAAAAYNIIVA